MADEFDVIIAGASISGLCMANYLANKGIKILIVDLNRIKSIGESVGGKILTEEAVTFLKNTFNIRIPAKFVEKKVDNTSIGLIKGSELLIGTDYYIINKKLLSSYLLGKIIDSENVTLLERHNIIGLLEDDRLINGLKIKDMSRGIVKEVKAKIVVDSSGSTAFIRRKVMKNRFFPRDINEFDKAVVYEEIIELNDEKIKHPMFYFDPSNLKSGYFWIIPEDGSRICVGIGVQGKSDNIKKLFDSYKNQLISSENAKIIEKGSGIITLRRPLNSFVYKNVMLVGSSACQVNPIIVRDISFGIKGAYYTSKAVLTGLKSDEIKNSNLWDYNINFMRDVGARCALLEGVRDFFSSLSTETFDFIIMNEVITSGLIENIGTNLRRRDVLFNTAKLFLKPRLLHKIIKLSNYSKRMEEYYNNYPAYDDFNTWKIKLNNELKNIRESFFV